MTTEIHVRFSRTDDARAAFPTVAGHVPAARLAETGIEVTCDAVAEAGVLHQLAHALDEWLVEARLPFAPLPVGDHTLLVRPPGD